MKPFEAKRSHCWVTQTVFGHLGPRQIGPAQMGTRTNGSRMHFYVIYPTPAEPSFFPTKRGFIIAIICETAVTFLWLGDLEPSIWREALH